MKFVLRMYIETYSNSDDDVKFTELNRNFKKKSNPSSIVNETIVIFFLYKSITNLNKNIFLIIFKAIR